MRIAVFLVVLFTQVSSAGSIYHCEGLDGRMTFQDKPCGFGSIATKQGESSEANGEHSIWVEPNYVDTEYSALLKRLDIHKVEASDPIHNFIPFGWIPYRVRAEVIEVYKGELEPGRNINVLVYISITNKKSLEHLEDDFLLSFCKSSNGTYYSSRDYVIVEPTKENVNKFREIKVSGTDYEGSGDCVGNYPSLDPDTHG